MVKKFSQKCRNCKTAKLFILVDNQKRLNSTFKIYANIYLQMTYKMLAKFGSKILKLRG